MPTKKEPLRKKLITLLSQHLHYCESYLEEKTKTKSDDFNRAFEMKEEDLPLHIHDAGLTGEFVAARLKGENIDTPKWHIRALWDVEFSVEEYRALGNNDGQLAMLNVVFSEIGETKLAERAIQAQYSE